MIEHWRWSLPCSPNTASQLIPRSSGNMAKPSRCGRQTALLTNCFFCNKSSLCFSHGLGLHIHNVKKFGLTGTLKHIAGITELNNICHQCVALPPLLQDKRDPCGHRETAISLVCGHVARPLRWFLRIGMCKIHFRNFFCHYLFWLLRTIFLMDCRHEMSLKEQLNFSTSSLRCRRLDIVHSKRLPIIFHSILNKVLQQISSIV